MTKLKRAQLQAQFNKQNRLNGDKKSDKRSLHYSNSDIINRLRHRTEKNIVDGNNGDNKTMDATGIEPNSPDVND